VHRFWIAKIMTESLKDLTIAVVGATGAVGNEFLRIMERRHPDLPTLRLLASSRSAGRKLAVGGLELVVEEATDQSFDGVDIAFISASGEISRRFAPVAVAAGAVVIDDGSAFRMDAGVPLVVPEVNGADLEWHSGITSIPNCSTTPVVMAAHPLNRVNPIRRIIADTYQSVSGAGGAAMDQLRNESRDLLAGKETKPASRADRMGFNVFPHIDSFQADGYTFEERKMIQETRKIMHLPEMALSATCVRVPVYVSHCVSLHIEFERPMSADEARGLLGAMPGVTVLDDPENNLYPVPCDVEGTDDVWVGRIRQDVSHPNGLALWVVSDNLRKGAALNSIQIAEELVSRRCLKRKGASRAAG
jgi:aspartate-semialdehyde dehydrogenase